VTELLGIRPVEIGDGKAVLEMEAGRPHHNVFGTVHGGLLCALADVAMGLALATKLENEGFSTLQQQMEHVRSRSEARLTARAQVVHRGRRVAHLRSSIADADGNLVAEASSVCLVFSL
jgi:uncharacterized protein (TIGR00369 family)